MRQWKKKRGSGEIDYWETTADLLISLLLVMMMVILLLGLYVLHIPDIINEDPWPGDSTGELVDDEEGEEEEEEDDEDDNEDTEQQQVVVTAGGEGDGDGDYDLPTEGIKSAVFVMLVDADTGKTVKEEGVDFELYSDDNGLQILNTYYPEKITYRDYETTEDGTFYLPEKIFEGGYYLRELNEISGYDQAEDQHFFIDRLYDWPEPYLVEVPVHPSQNVIRVQMNDQTTGAPIDGGVFDVVAAQNIVTLDGTIRYVAGETVGEIVCDEKGYGSSEELYLGSYTLRQKVIPEYYASVKEPISAAVSKKADVEPAVHKVLSEKTSVDVILTDELYDTAPLEGVPFTVTGGGNAETVETDGRGRIRLEDLDKGATYHIRQADATGDYLPDTEDHVLAVDSNGRIGGEAHTELALTNRLIRVTIGVEDALLHTQVSDVNLALYDSADQLVQTWTTTGVAVTLNNLHEGSYYVIKDGDEGRRYMLNVRNTAELQELNVTFFTWRSAAVIGIGLLVAALVIAVVTVLIRSIRKKSRLRKEKEAEKLSAAIEEEMLNAAKESDNEVSGE